jgi:anti-anti-sigma factor
MSLLSDPDVPVVPHRDHVRVEPTGELDVHTCPPLRAQLDELWESGWTDIVLDLREVTFMDSTALHVVMDNHRRAARDAARFAIIDGPEAVGRVLTITGLRGVLEFTTDAAERRIRRAPALRPSA